MLSLSDGAFAQVLAEHLEDTASFHPGPIAFFFISGLMYGFGAKARVYGNHVLLCNVGHESLCIPNHFGNLHRGYLTFSSLLQTNREY